MKPELDSTAKPYVITLHGDLGLADQDRIAALFPDPTLVEDRIVLDCTNVSSMDSAILALIMIYRRRLQIAGRDPLATLVAIAPARLVRLFELTGTSRAITVLPLESSPEE